MSNSRGCPVTAPRSTTCSAPTGPTGRPRSIVSTRACRGESTRSSSSARAWVPRWRCGPALERPDVAGLVCINPATRTRDADTMAMIDDLHRRRDRGRAGRGLRHRRSGRVTTSPTTEHRCNRCDRSCTTAIANDHRPIRRARPCRCDCSRHARTTWSSPPTANTSRRASAGRSNTHGSNAVIHVATRDYDRDFVTAESVAFVERVAG